MNIDFSCDQCGKKYRADEHLTGEQFMCRECGHEFPIGGEREPSVGSARLMQPEVEPTPAPPRVRTPVYREKPYRRERDNTDLSTDRGFSTGQIVVTVIFAILWFPSAIFCAAGFHRSEVCYILRDIGTRESIKPLQEVARERRGFVSGPAKEALRIINQRMKQRR